jgi:hypothetical protein
VKGGDQGRTVVGTQVGLSAAKQTDYVIDSSQIQKNVICSEVTKGKWTT